MRPLIPSQLTALLAGFAAVLLWAGPSWAQPSESAPPAPRFTPHIEDPMLAPMPRPATQLESWEEARTLLFRHSTDLRQAQAAVQRAEGRWRQSLSTLLPNARLSAGVGVDLLNPGKPFSALSPTVAGLPGATSPLATAGVSLTQSLVDLSAWRGVASASASEKSAELSLSEVKRDLTQGLARTLVAVVAAERAAEINRISLRQALERAALAERTFELGAGTQVDVVRVQQDVAVARGALVAGDEQLRQTREALGLSLGLQSEAGVREDFGLEGLVEQTAQECRAIDALEARPDLLAALAQVEAARESRKQASAGYLPSLGLSSSLVAATIEPGPVRVPTWSLSAVLSMPLWEGGFRRGLITEREGVVEQAAQTAEQLRRSLTVEVSRARRGSEVAAHLVAAATDARDLAKRSDELTRRSFEIGRATSLELVQSAQVLRQAELTLALREFEWVQARLDAFLTEARCDG